ncbi:hypothetical protein N7471_010310 [Penicillium samsonianum]|uniref:uncharacterized protein n=1 Tax=Penicillium samsonianum TaxID=1882272 RepID=UPI0025492CCF|nr:uncharacterized protein N7471_010310 [Penicillium samsonianum]KAJ6125817.1 hypothetical protein N7471_010310 [Penicillium samsonianum]
MIMAHRKQYLEGAAIVGEFKRPRVIKRREWIFEKRPSNTTKRLMQEIRGLIDFKQICLVDICIIPREEVGYDDQCTMAEGLRALALRDFTRLCATGDSTPTDSGNNIRPSTKLSRVKFDRRYEFWSGRPFWVDRRTRETILLDIDASLGS